MEGINGFHIVLKETLDKNDYDFINELEKTCTEADNVELKLELDYKLKRGEVKKDKLKDKLKDINEFMCFYGSTLVGYLGICYFGGKALEINGMVHPDYRRRGIFTKLLTLAEDEWKKRSIHEMLLLTDSSSSSGKAFIKAREALYDSTEYNMVLESSPKERENKEDIVLRKAYNNDSKEIARQNSIYFNMEVNEENNIIPEEEEKCGTTIYIAEFKGDIIGKVHLGITEEEGGIYGLGILPEYRGRGFGREVVNLSIDKLREKNVKKIVLQVLAANNKALSLYKSCGFVEKSKMDYYKITKM